MLFAMMALYFGLTMWFLVLVRQQPDRSSYRGRRRKLHVAGLGAVAVVVFTLPWLYAYDPLVAFSIATPASAAADLLLWYADRIPQDG